MIACVKNVRVDGNLQDLRDFVNKKNGVVFDGCKVTI